MSYRSSSGRNDRGGGGGRSRGGYNDRSGGGGSRGGYSNGGSYNNDRKSSYESLEWVFIVCYNYSMNCSLSLAHSRLNDYKSSKKRWDMSRLPRFEKDFYKEHPIVAARNDVS